MAASACAAVAWIQAFGAVTMLQRRLFSQRLGLQRGGPFF